MWFLRRLSLAFLLLFLLAAVAPDTRAQVRHDDRTQTVAEGTRRPIGGAVKGAITGAIAGAVGAIWPLKAKPESDHERNLKEPGRPYF